VRQLDLVWLKNEVKLGRILFYVRDGKIFCKDPRNGERVIVGETKEQEDGNA